MSEDELSHAIEKLRPLHEPKRPAAPADWLSVHPEPGQSFDEYVQSDPMTPTGSRRVIHVQPLGEFSEAGQRVVEMTAEFMGLFYDRPAEWRDGLALELVPQEARRIHPTRGVEQVLSTYVLTQVLRPRLPEDAAAYIAFTLADLWPGEGWNFVFGQASLRDRVGVWSIYRNGDPEAGPDQFRLCLLRTMKTGSHELGHMFGMAHCTAYECGMNGSNTLQEKDRRPLALCPECVAKVCWATGAEPGERFRRLAAFCAEHGLAKQAGFYRQSARALGDLPPS